MANILAASLNAAEPVLFCLASAQIALHDEDVKRFHENGWRSLLAVLTSFTKLGIHKEALIKSLLPSIPPTIVKPLNVIKRSMENTSLDL
jgi:hypothetical protein